MTGRIALGALIALKSRGLPFHDPFHGLAVTIGGHRKTKAH